MRERIEGRNRIHSAVVSRKGPQPPSDLRRTGTPCRLPQWHSPYPGASGQAQTVIDESARRFPSDTLLNNVSLPTASAAIEIGRGDPAKAIELLRPASPYELGRFADFAPIYVRGLAYLRARNGAQAAVEFRKILDHRGVDPVSPLYALARLGLARAYALSGDPAKSRIAYQDFLALWKDADPDVPILMEAKAGYAKLQ